MGLWGEKDGTFFRVDEFYHDSKQKGFQMTDEEYYCSLTALIGDRKVEYAVVDPSAASFIECIKRHGKIRVVRADNDVVKGNTQNVGRAEIRQDKNLQAVPRRHT